MFNSDITIDEFLQNYWQKKPFLFRNAFANFASPASADELAGLACEEDSNARLIIETKDKPFWSVEHGPFEEDRFATLPETNWTILVSDVEKHIPEARELLNHFRFIPDWRIDDLMISYAVKGGSVGPHVDDYDVFLLQAQGQRHWSISASEDINETLEDIDIRILKSFTAQQQWTLDSGDMLYLPPNVAHHGVAVDDCITCSIGFRSPSVHTMISEYAESLAVRLPQALRYSDAEMRRQDHPAEITQDSLSRIKKILTDNLRIDDAFIQRWFGELITESNSSVQVSQRQDNAIEIKDLAQCRGFTFFSQSPLTKFLYSQYHDHALVFVDGQSYETSLGFAQTLCGNYRIASRDLLESIQSKDDETICLTLLSHGYLGVDDDI